MDRINLPTSETPEIRIKRVHGSLRIKGWDRPEFRADSDESDTLSVAQDNNVIDVNCNSGCMVRMPVESAIEIERVDRELMLKSIECSIVVGKVSGQIMAKSIGSLKIDSASSNLIVRNCEGSFECNQVDGNANLQDIEGTIKLAKVNGNLIIKGFTSGIEANTNGNTTLRLDPEPGRTFNINAKGNISCRLSAETNANIKLISGAKKINVNSFGMHETHRTGEYEFSLGEGESDIILKANGAIDLSIPVLDETDWSYEFDLGEDISMVADDISQMVSEQIETQLDTLTENLNNLAKNLSHLGSFDSEKNREKLEAKRLRLERKLAQIERRTTERARLANRKVSAAARRFQRQNAPTDPVTDSERQKVLEMLQEKQISVQEAEILLAALEGRKPDFPDKNSLKA